ncbi:MAG: HPP family protein [Geobacteraceae bacterium]|nr:HPP family protein [Geobacteraceae bacterium]
MRNEEKTIQHATEDEGTAQGSLCSPLPEICRLGICQRDSVDIGHTRCYKICRASAAYRVIRGVRSSPFRGQRIAFGATRNLIGGDLVSAVAAVVAVAFLGTDPLSTSLAVGVSILLMYITRTIHPPGGSTALIGVMGGAG